jgi:hypothetical protein
MIDAHDRRSDLTRSPSNENALTKLRARKVARPPDLRRRVAPARQAALQGKGSRLPEARGVVPAIGVEGGAPSPSARPPRSSISPPAVLDNAPNSASPSRQTPAAALAHSRASPHLPVVALRLRYSTAELDLSARRAGRHSRLRLPCLLHQAPAATAPARDRASPPLPAVALRLPCPTSSPRRQMHQRRDGGHFSITSLPQGVIASPYAFVVEEVFLCCGSRW